MAHLVRMSLRSIPEPRKVSDESCGSTTDSSDDANYHSSSASDQGGCGVEAREVLLKRQVQEMQPIGRAHLQAGADELATQPMTASEHSVRWLVPALTAGWLCSPERVLFDRDNEIEIQLDLAYGK
eukprot:TRINITY_DN1596_c0_g1_i1.p1 TRINITY_DN1596_c0_g1~~TRINITY_DN1596_c0_g1_i1.p1  ORF type:complete len:144 (+),score=12.77 TRINITY_DN1596_c0_g1_i1:56-433(+)